MIAFISALREERTALQKAWCLQEAGVIQGFEVEAGPDCVHLCSGMGAKRVREGVEVLRQVYRPRILILIGFSVGVTDGVRVGDLIVDSRSHPEILEKLRKSSLKADFSQVGKCDFLLTSESKSEWGRDNKPHLVADLESQEFLKAVGTKSLSLVVRSVSDDVHTDLPLDFSKFVDARGFPCQRKLAKAVLKRPLLIPRMLRLARDAKTATSRLEQFCASLRSLIIEYSAALKDE